MAVTLDLRLIDHCRVVENGISAVNNALAANEGSIIADYILTMPFTPDSAAVACRQARCDKLREVNAPDVIIQYEERILQLVNGNAYSRDELSKKTMDELRELLGTWGWAENSFSIGNAWHPLDWFLQPTDGPDQMYPLRPSTGDPTQMPLDQALKGGQQSPHDNSGSPIIRTCGSKGDDCFGYNPPCTIAEITKALSAINDASWDELVTKRIRQYNQAALIPNDSVADVVGQELVSARMGFAVMCKAYNLAQERGFGVACEYSL